MPHFSINFSKDETRNRQTAVDALLAGRNEHNQAGA